MKNNVSTGVGINKVLLDKVRKIVEENPIDYPSISNFVNKAVIEKLKQTEG